tara:strand:- start:1046 stop:1207 length:162 start_codon:yes stop_codon:yes gene_type:complete
LEAEVRLEYPVKRAKRMSIWVNGGFEFRNTETDIFDGEAQLSDDRLRITSNCL